MLLYRFKDYKITKEQIGEQVDKTVMIVRPSVLRDLFYQLTRCICDFCRSVAYVPKARVVMHPIFSEDFKCLYTIAR